LLITKLHVLLIGTFLHDQHFSKLTLNGLVKILSCISNYIFKIISILNEDPFNLFVEKIKAQLA